MFASISRWTRNGEYLGETSAKSTVLTRTQGLGNSPSSSNVQNGKAKPVEIKGRHDILSTVFLVDGEHVVSGGAEGLIRRWRGENGMDMGMPMDAGSPVGSIAVSQDGRWVVGGTESGVLTVWNAETHRRVTEFKGHSDWVRAVDVSPNAMEMATGSDDKTACVWSFTTQVSFSIESTAEQRVLGPLKHKSPVVAVKFSPDGRLIATATWLRTSIRVYHRQDGRLLVDIPIQVSSCYNGSLAWAGDSRQLFALSRDGNINCLDVSTGTTLSKWPIHNRNNPLCITLTSDSHIIAASADSSVSFWDTTTHKQIGSVIEHTHAVWSMAISANYDLVVGGNTTITIRGLSQMFPSPYFDAVSATASNPLHEMAS